MSAEVHHTELRAGDCTPSVKPSRPADSTRQVLMSLEKSLQPSQENNTAVPVSLLVVFCIGICAASLALHNERSLASRPEKLQSVSGPDTAAATLFFRFLCTKQRSISLGHRPCHVVEPALSGKHQYSSASLSTDLSQIHTPPRCGKSCSGASKSARCRAKWTNVSHLPSDWQHVFCEKAANEKMSPSSEL